MKKYCLVIDTSETSPEPGLFVFDADTVKEAKAKLDEMNLRFGLGFVYCATIGKRLKGCKNHFDDYLRTDDGLRWRRPYEKALKSGVYAPEGWRRISDWRTVSQFRRSE